MSKGNQADENFIWVFLAPRMGEIQEITYELLTEAQNLSREKGLKIGVFSTVEDVKGLDEINKWGAERLITGSMPAGENAYEPDRLIALCETFIGQVSPTLLLFPSDSLGNDLAVRLSAKYNLSLLVNCSKVSFDEDDVVATKATFGGKVYSSYRLAGRGMKIITLVPGVVGTEEVDRPSEMATEKLADLAAGKRAAEIKAYEVTEFIKGDPKDIDIRDADMILAVGRGLGGAENIQVMEEWAEVMGASLGCTRPLVDDRVLPFERQIGQTGRTVKPKVIISCGISGAIHHQVGMKETKHIVVVNTDKDALMFNLATLKVLGDMHEIAPELIFKMRKEKEIAG